LGDESCFCEIARLEAIHPGDVRLSAHCVMLALATEFSQPAQFLV
jgi:hypothetical protein